MEKELTVGEVREAIIGFLKEKYPGFTIQEDDNTVAERNDLMGSNSLLEGKSIEITDAPEGFQSCYLKIDIYDTDW